MWKDPIVEELHAVRAQLLARFDGDLHKYCDYVMSLPSPVSALQAVQSTLPAVCPPIADEGQPRLK